MPAPFLIYNASAGAGKTYNLVRQYLKLCLQGKDSLSFMGILAITFTNKAANEMKNRLIKQLQVLGQFPNLESGDLEYCLSLAKELRIEPEELKYRAEESLAGILHNYSAFAVSTIDRFTNRLIRSFSRDLKLNSNYQIELQVELILEEAVDRVLDELKDNSPFAQILSEFIRRQLNDEKSPDARRLLYDLGQELFKERSIDPLEALKQIEAEGYLEIEKRLNGRLEKIKSTHQAQAKALFDFFKEKAIVKGSFRDQWLFPHLQKMAEGSFQSFGKKALELLEGPAEDMQHRSNAEAQAFIPHAEQIQANLQKTQDYFEANIEEKFLLEQVLSRISALAVLTEIELKLEEVKQESNRLPIGEFNKIISQELRKQPAPFIYERMGERYRHYFIDEFQDTSLLQWYNLVPLINNSLAERPSSAMIVGDAKQSIYRFRGGELQLFVDLVNDREPSNTLGDQRLYERSTINLGSNFRSLQEVVQFNNEFFAFAANELQNSEHRSLYLAGKQEAAGKPGGYVAFHQLEQQDFKETQLEYLPELLNDLFDRGYQQKDICFLVRSNEEGRAAAQFLLQASERINTPGGKAIQILSVDSLVVGASEAVCALVSFLKMVEQGENKEIRKDWLEYAYKIFGKDGEERHQFLSEHRDYGLNDELSFLESEAPDFKAKEWQSQDLIQQIYQLAKALKMPWQSDPYLQFFLDQAQDYLQNHRPISREFLDWWEEHGYKKSVSLPESIDAVQVMSIHRSKGLEFPVVICLNVSKKLDDKLSLSSDWIDLRSIDGIDFEGLPYALISFKNPESELHQSVYHELREAEKAKVKLDNLNARYVAFTRAERELHIISPSPPKKPEDHLEHLLAQFFEAHEPGVYSVGQKTQAIKAEGEDRAYENKAYNASAWHERIEALSSAPKNWQKLASDESRWGKQVHQLLAHLEKASDLEKVIKRAEKEAWFEAEEIEKLSEQMRNLLRIPEIMELFDDSVEVYNERSLLLPGGGQKIPDRLVKRKELWYIADYKSGSPRPEHRNQVNEYRDLMEKAGFKVARLYLIYLNAEELSLETWS